LTTALDAKQAARTLTDRIKVAVEGTWLLIQDAYTSRAWAELGYPNWDTYCTEEFGASRLRLPREERQEVVASLRESGLSTRAIAAATGINRETVMKDLQVVGNQPPAEPLVIGVDGKSYAASRPQPAPEPADEYAGAEWLEPDEDAIPGQSHVLDHTDLETVAPTVQALPPEPAKPKRRPLPEAFADGARDLKRATEQLTRLTQDDRFTRNRETTHHQMPDLISALEHTAELLQAMNLPEAEASEEARRWWAASLNKTSDALTGIAQSINQER